MLYAHFYDGNGEEFVGLTDWNEYHNLTFSPDCKVLSLIDFVIHGKTYQERKNNLRELAIDFLIADSEASGGLSYMEWGEIVHETCSRIRKGCSLLSGLKEGGLTMYQKMTDIEKQAWKIGVYEAHTQKRIVPACQSKKMMKFISEHSENFGDCIPLLIAYNNGVGVEIGVQTSFEM